MSCPGLVVKLSESDSASFVNGSVVPKSHPALKDCNKYRRNKKKMWKCCLWGKGLQMTGWPQNVKLLGIHMLPSMRFRDGGG